jgi:hypothetical protein
VPLMVVFMGAMMGACATEGPCWFHSWMALCKCGPTPGHALACDGCWPMELARTACDGIRTGVGSVNGCGRRARAMHFRALRASRSA